ncbi:MAG: pyruvate dehydrogenase (acetyl-transferring) E1 component subunit alpha [Proteobacteria bacterium]|nr:pyruvate dehydrogenase (acetyl-transferring) E1 component subunit alpha [Pseudomonadota bacterium]
MAESVTKEQLLEMYRMMCLIRRVEELAAKAYTQRKIIGFCHLYIGMEAVAVGTSSALRPEDVVVAAYREHGQILARGVDPELVFGELFGKRTGTTQGVGGSMHMASREHNFWGGYGIVGGHIPLAAGAAFAAKYKGDDSIALVYFGDGAAQQGVFYEALEMAQLWKLPCIFLCENNFYAMGTSLERQSYLTDMSRRGDGVGMTRWQFEGFDAVEVHNNIAKAAEHCRSGKGPVIVEAVTYRYRGHSMSDPAKYRKDGELEEKKKRDGIDLAIDRLKSEHGVSDAELEAIKADVDVQAQAAYDAALAAPDADPSKLYDFTYATEAQ